MSCSPKFLVSPSRPSRETAAAPPFPPDPRRTSPAKHPQKRPDQNQITPSKYARCPNQDAAQTPYSAFNRSHYASSDSPPRPRRSAPERIVLLLPSLHPHPPTTIAEEDPRLTGSASRWPPIPTSSSTRSIRRLHIAGCTRPGSSRSPRGAEPRPAAARSSMRTGRPAGSRRQNRLSGARVWAEVLMYCGAAAPHLRRPGDLPTRACDAIVLVIGEGDFLPVARKISALGTRVAVAKFQSTDVKLRRPDDPPGPGDQRVWPQPGPQRRLRKTARGRHARGGSHTRTDAGRAPHICNAAEQKAQ